MATSDSQNGVSSVVEQFSVRARSAHLLRRADLTPHPRQIERFAAMASTDAMNAFLSEQAKNRCGKVGASRLTNCTSTQNASGTSNTIPVLAGAPAGSTPMGRPAPGHTSHRSG